jgi:DNA-binding response OmpR family regulator
MSVKLLLVDDDAELTSMLRKVFEESDFRVDTANSGVSGIDCVRRERYDLVILDIMLPMLNGFDVLRQLRPEFRVPVILLTARTGRFDRVYAFESGADDYVTKPFYPEELLGRVRAVLRRSAPQTAAPAGALRAGDLTILPGSRNAYFRSKDLELTAMECEILEQLVRCAGHPVSRDQLSFHIYARESSPYDRSIDTHVSRIRRKLGSDGRALITSVRGTGYQLRIPVEPAAS